MTKTLASILREMEVIGGEGYHSGSRGRGVHQ